MVKILERYLIREVLAAWAAVTVVLLLILISSYIGRFLADIAAGEVPGDLLFSLLALKTVGALGLMLPASLFLAAMLALGRLYRDSEMVVMSSCGLGPAKLYRALAMLGVPACIGLALVSLWLAPQAAATGQALRDNASRDAQVATLQAGRFQPISGGRTVYVGEAADEARRFRQVLIIGGEAGSVDVVTAQSGIYYPEEGEAGRYLVLEDGHRAIGRPGQTDFRLLNFARNTVRLPPASAAGGTAPLEARPTLELAREDSAVVRAELHWRLAPPLSVIVLLLLAVPAARIAPRESRYSKLVLGFLIYLSYANLLGLGRVWIEQGRVPEAAGLWWMHGLFAVLALFWVAAQYRRRRPPREAPA